MKDLFNWFMRLMKMVSSAMYLPELKTSMFQMQLLQAWMALALVTHLGIVIMLPYIIFSNLYNCLYGGTESYMYT